MGRASLEKPKRLAEKLLAIRVAKGLSQNGLIHWLGCEEKLTQAEISAFERGVRVPSLITLLKYARRSDISIELLIDDNLELPGEKQCL